MEHKQGKHNVAVDALSRRGDYSGLEEFTLLALSYLLLELLQRIKVSYIQKVVRELTANPQSHPHHEWKDGEFEKEVLVRWWGYDCIFHAQWTLGRPFRHVGY